MNIISQRSLNRRDRVYHGWTPSLSPSFVHLLHSLPFRPLACLDLIGAKVFFTPAGFVIPSHRGNNYTYSMTCKALGIGIATTENLYSAKGDLYVCESCVGVGSFVWLRSLSSFCISKRLANNNALSLVFSAQLLEYNFNIGTTLNWCKCSRGKWSDAR